MSYIRRAYCFWLMLSAALFLLLPANAQMGARQQENTQKLLPAQSFSGAYLAGRIASANNDKTAAIDYFRQALTFDPGNIQLEEDLLLLLLSNNEFAQAVPLAAALKDNAQVERASRLTLAADAFNNQNFDEIDALLTLENPDLMDDLIARLIGAWALFAQGDGASAIRQLEQMEGPGWYDLFRYYHLALLYDLAGDAAGAQKAFEQAMETQAGAASAPDSYERIIAAFSVHLQAMGRPQQANDLLQKGAETLSGRKVLDMMRLAVIRGESLPQLVTNAGEGAAEVLYTIGTAINRPGSEAYAQLYLNIALGLRPDHDATLFQLADIDSRTGQNRTAITLYQRIPPQSPYFQDARWRLGLILADAGREKEAIELLQSAIEASPDDETLVIALASVYMQAKNFADVITLINSYIEANNIIDNIRQDKTSLPLQQAWRLFFQRGIAHERLQQWQQAEADFRYALELFPEQPQVLNYLGYSLIDRDMKLEEAIEMVRRAAELRPKDGAIIDSLGWAYYKIGLYDEAIEALEEAVRLRPEDPTINDHLGDAYWRVGRRFEAVFQWNHALTGGPEPEDLALIEDKLKNGLDETSPGIATIVTEP